MDAFFDILAAVCRIVCTTYHCRKRLAIFILVFLAKQRDSAAMLLLDSAHQQKCAHVKINCGWCTTRRGVARRGEARRCSSAHCTPPLWLGGVQSMRKRMRFVGPIIHLVEGHYLNWIKQVQLRQPAVLTALYSLVRTAVSPSLRAV